ncbi:hypothetical protein K0U83_22250 [bacterium]|nr:hypothetical protein [bacterium]
MADPIRGGLTSKGAAVLARIEKSVDPRSANMRRVIADMRKAAEDLEASAKAGWPVDRNTQGSPTRGDHSVDDFGIDMRISGTKIVAVVYNRAPYAYYIRSVMTGETSAEQRRRHRWLRGTDADRYNAQRNVGRKRHAFTVQLRTPGRKAGRKLARELQTELVDIMQKVT